MVLGRSFTSTTVSDKATISLAMPPPLSSDLLLARKEGTDSRLLRRRSCTEVQMRQRGFRVGNSNVLLVATDDERVLAHDGEDEYDDGDDAEAE